MKKNVIICIMGVLLLLTTYKCLCYRRAYFETSDMCFELRNKPFFDCLKEMERDREARKILPPYNYLSVSDINNAPVHVYSYDTRGNFPKEGLTRTMAARMAEAVWFSQFGDRIIQCRPYSVVFSKGLWIVAANDHSEESVGNPYMEIDSKDGRIVRYILGK